MPVFVGAGTSSFMKGSGGVGISTMTTTQRNALSGVKKGQFIYNETLNLAQYYDGSAWKSIDSPPIVTGVAIDGRASGTTGYLNRNSGGTSTLIITGSSFDTFFKFFLSILFCIESRSANFISVSIISRSLIGLTSLFTF